MSFFQIEVCFPTMEKQTVVKLQVAENTTVSQAIDISNIKSIIGSSVDFSKTGIAIFGKIVKNTNKHLVKKYDRIDICPPLILDIRAKKAEQRNKQK
jgi:putative ubiquitin-RnfH superfamily antitoxin RatB of RatAB toxin-antitoxin module